MPLIRSSKFGAIFIALLGATVGLVNAEDSSPASSEWFVPDTATSPSVDNAFFQTNPENDTAFPVLASALGLLVLGGGCLLWLTRRREKICLKQLESNEQRLTEAQRIACLGSWTRDFASGETYWSPEARAVLMLGDNQKGLKHYETYVHPEDYERVVETIARAYHQGGAYGCDHRVICPTGVQKYVRLAGQVFLSEATGFKVREHGTVQDITERKLLETQLKSSQEQLSSILDASPDAIMVFNCSDSFVLRFANPACYRLFGLAVHTDLAALDVISHWVSQELHSQFHEELGQTGRVKNFEAIFRKTDGALFWASLDAVEMVYGGDKAVFISAHDISAKRAIQEELERLATTDPLTGVLNRRSFYEAAGKEFRRAMRYDQPVSLCVIELDQFKALNDGFGHAFGDLLIQKFVELLKDCLRIEDSVGRMGGEEFALLLVGANQEGGRLVAERIRKICEDERIELDRQVMTITISAGVAGREHSQENLEDVMARAGQALQQAKQMGRNCVVMRKGKPIAGRQEKA